eukprot:jgi/Bigna1/69702/fgenesh1_pg.9_\
MPKKSPRSSPTTRKRQRASMETDFGSIMSKVKKLRRKYINEQKRLEEERLELQRRHVSASRDYSLAKKQHQEKSENHVMEQRLAAAKSKQKRAEEKYEANLKELKDKTKMIRQLEDKEIGREAKRHYNDFLYRERCIVRDSRLSTLVNLFLFLMCIVLPIVLRSYASLFVLVVSLGTLIARAIVKDEEFEDNPYVVSAASLPGAVHKMIKDLAYYLIVTMNCFIPGKRRSFLLPSKEEMETMLRL